MDVVYNDLIVFLRDTVFLALGRDEALRLVSDFKTALPFLLNLVYIFFSVALLAHIVFTLFQKMPWYRYPAYVFKRLAVTLGLANRYEPWGVVYDAVTKQPLANARVEIINKQNRVLETRSTDKCGRYSFLINTESLLGDELMFSLRVVKEGYVFPSTLIQPPHDTIAYDNVYVGGWGLFESDILIDFDVPLDPAPLPVKIPRSNKLPSALAQATATVLYWLALIIFLVIVPFIDFSYFNGLLLIIALIIGIYVAGNSKKQPRGRVINTQTKQPVAHALVTLKDDNQIQKGFTVTDDSGNYFMLTEPGAYLLTVRSPAGSHDDRVFEKRIKTKDGWIAENIKL